MIELVVGHHNKPTGLMRLIQLRAGDLGAALIVIRSFAHMTWLFVLRICSGVNYKKVHIFLFDSDCIIADWVFVVKFRKRRKTY